MKKKAIAGVTKASAWQVTMAETKAVHKYKCLTCKRVTTYEKPARSPWCVECFDAMMLSLGLERMKDLGEVKQAMDTADSYIEARAAMAVLGVEVGP